MAYEMSGKMPENQEEAAAIISERMSNMKPGQSRAMSRIDNSVGVKEWWDAFSDDPLEITSNYGGLVSEYATAVGYENYTCLGSCGSHWRCFVLLV